MTLLLRSFALGRDVVTSLPPQDSSQSLRETLVERRLPHPLVDAIRPVCRLKRQVGVEKPVVICQSIGKPGEQEAQLAGKSATAQAPYVISDVIHTVIGD